MTEHGTSPRRGRRVRHRAIRRSTAVLGAGIIPGLSARRRRSRGQSLVEFALVFPLFILLVMAVVEFAFAFNANLAIAFASRDAALVAAEAGDGLNSDCAIIQSVINDVGAPADAAQITSIEIYWSDQNGNYKNPDSSLKNLWNHTSGVHEDLQLPRRLAADRPLPAGDLRLSRRHPLQRRRRLRRIAHAIGRHDRRAGRTTTYTWKTPMSGLVGLAGNGPAWTITGFELRPIERDAHGAGPVRRRPRSRRDARARAEPRRVLRPRPGVPADPLRDARVRVRVHPQPDPRVRDPRRRPDRRGAGRRRWQRHRVRHHRRRRSSPR